MSSRSTQRRRTARLAVASLAVLGLGAALAGCSSGSSSGGSTNGADESFTIGIVEQQLANPFFANLQNAAKSAAEDAGLKVITAESKTAGDSASQVAAIENMIAQGVKGIVLDPANATALVDIVQRARDAGILVVTVNTSLEPADAADASFETDNLAGGELMGQWAKAALGTEAPQIAMLDYDLSDKTAGARHDGFLQGFGITDDSPEIVGTALTKSNVETGQSAMENLLSAHPDINAIYTINEPAAQGAYIAISNAGKQDQVKITSIDGSCSGVQSVADGEIGATVMQFPSKMGQLAVQSIIDYVKTGTKPSGVNDSGTTLITDQPVDGVESETSEWGLQNCWGGE
jgi:fructose transport system substrate-binding protein